MKHNPSCLAIVFALLGGALHATAQPAGQWDFNNGNLNATVGEPLTYLDSATQAGAQFGTTTSFNIPDIGGQPASVIRLPGVTDPGAGLTMPVPNISNGGGALLNDYTLIMDVLFPSASSGLPRAILETDLGLFNSDADLWVNGNNGIGRKGDAFGAVAPDTWHRLGFVVDASNNRLRFYIDGREVGAANESNLVDGRYALNSGVYAFLFSDDTGEVQPAFVNSIQFRASALSANQMRALAGPTAEGIPQVLPPVPSVVDRWIPRGSYASRDTAIGAIIDPGDTTIADASISLTLDGVAVASPTISRANGLITVEKTSPGLTLGQHTVVLTFTDSLAGEKTLTNTFSAALFFEDFENVELLPSKEEPAQFEQGWTHTPPPGWSVDNSQFPATIIGPDNPDDDGDGYADMDGRTEWAGWSFATKEFWVAAEMQRREEFTLGEGVIAIADTDEWDDSPHVQSLFNSFLISPEISIEGLGPNSMYLAFSSSWRPEGADDTGASFPTGPNGEALNNQTATITASFDGGAPIEIMKWDSIAGSPTYHDHRPNEEVVIPIPNPAGASKLVLTFSLTDGANDWWWAVDNIAVGAGGTPPIIGQNPTPVEVQEGQPASLSVQATGDGLSYQWFKGIGDNRAPVNGATAATYSIAAAASSDTGIYTVEVSNANGKATSEPAMLTVLPSRAGRIVLLEEDFDDLPLGPSVDEGVAGDAVWTKTPPAGWEIDDSGVPGVGTDEDGVTEWAGWSFANREWWALTAEDQQRSQFTKGTGTSAIVDSDEWDDIAHAPGNMATYLSTAPISLEGVEPGSVIVQFDSSWRAEANQTANVTARFDDGEPVEVLRFESDTNSDLYHADAVNETVVILINNPAGASEMVLTFGYFNTRNNWWWAFDNLVVLAKEEGSGGGDEPSITFTRSGDQITLSWTGDGFVLQESASLGDGAAWTATPGVTGNSATVTVGAGAKFYRLRK